MGTAIIGWSRRPPETPNHALEPTATARLARVVFGFEFAPVAFELALPVAVAQLDR